MMHSLLIIDDQTVLADDLADMLPWDTVGIDTVHKAYSGREALEVMREHSIDVVVTDIRMPGMSGLELIGEIKKNWKHTKCILLTGYADFEYTKQALQLKSSDYLLKPVADEELMEAVRKAIGDLEQEWQEIASTQRAMYALREQLPKLREYMLLDLITGKTTPSASLLAKRLDMYEIPLREGDGCHMMLLRIDDTSQRYDGDSEALLDYALTNIAQELFGDRMHLWHCKDMNGYIVCLLTPKQAEAALDPAELESWLETQAALLQHAAKSYLRVGISVLTSNRGQFPGEISSLYQSSLASFRHFIGRDTELFVSLAKAPTRGEPQLLSELHRPPTLSSMLEIGNWEAADEKLEAILRELENEWHGSQEYILEVYLMLAGTIAALIHKNKKWLADTIGSDFYTAPSGQPLATVEELRSWSQRVIASYRKSVSSGDKDSRSSIVRQVQDFIARNLDSASLHTISASVYLNPSYLSKIYKLETGEGISEYMLRIRMEKASTLLAQSPEKIYEISVMLGYQKPSYFIQLFKKHYGLTPQEYRNKLGV
ncbi:two-component system response regulator YesN [Paenibacillus phyllosphaerae]|uniref:Two-component system response regulator YesN n=1 Tax=Paenibacillus phyllosphaerae TaxID=274593 RepID=A0A7W5B173_9BACL|nr:response regulator [Paenibacillus phyllosphaerae]MBB3112564.1 two-component system response regulator YesN [Paenibacillus phyllosphaerae]